jgi:predicted RNase H-like nuclease (RuvC/YqgF family)
MHGNGNARNPNYWKLRKATALQRENETLKTQLALLHSELAHKQTFVGRLELLIHQRNERINELNDKLAQSRDQCQRLEAECEHLADIIRLAPPVDTAMLAAK